MNSDKTHRDYLEVIGTTNATTRNYLEKRWNQYYFLTYRHMVNTMLGDIGDDKSVIDVGTSHGNWCSFLKRKGFKRIYGVELDSHRAELARRCGYNEVYNCDASSIPCKDNTIDYAVSNDVFVHILKVEDKIAVIKEVGRILKPGGIFIFNHTISNAFNYSNYHVFKHCSFLSLNELILMVTRNTGFKILDVKPTYYMFRRKNRSGILNKIQNFFILLPLAVTLRFVFDYLNCRNLGIENSDSVYIKVTKL